MDDSDGLALMRDVITTVQANVRVVEKRTNIYFDLIQAFRDRGCRSLLACADIDPAFDAAFDEIEEKRRT